MLKLLQNISGQKLLLPFYHEVAEKPLPHLNGLYKVRSPQQFENELDFYLKHFTPIGLDDLISHIHNKEPFQKPSFLLSFDDGLHGVHEFVMPILKRKGLEALLFVNPAFVGNQDMMFRLKAALVANELKKPQNKGMKYIAKYIFKLKHEHTEHINELAKELELDFNDYLNIYKPYLSVDQLKELQNNGFQIGGHTHSHPELRYLPLEEQVTETLSSMAWVKEHLIPKHQIFSFPFTDFGITNLFYDRTQNDIDLYFGGAGLKLESNPKHLHRIPIENYKTANKMVYIQYLYWLLKMPFGKNKITRN